jgi:Rrf2 family nitric oxide-sensitive transcriptional repressor
VLQLTKRAEYGLIALTRLLAEVLKDLTRTGHVVSQRGANGGYALSRPADTVTLGEVVAALEGHPSITSCESLGAFRAGSCDVSPRCPIRTPMQRIRSGIWNMMQRTTLRDLADPAFELNPGSRTRIPFSA